MYDLIIINSPLFREKTASSDGYLPPLGLVYIASYLESKNKKVELLDSLDIGLGVQEIVDYINNKSPKYVGINVFSVNFELVKEICESIHSKTNVIIGGNLAKFFYKTIASWNFKTKCYVIIGEGEKIVNAILDDNIQESKIYEKNNVVVYRVNKDSLYYEKELDNFEINRKFIKNGYLNVYNEIEEAIISSRGCFYDCAYCGSARSINEDLSVRSRSIGNIGMELTQIKSQNPNVKCIRILDDLFLKNRKSIEESIQLFNNYPDLFWRAMAHVNSFMSSIDLFDNMYRSGCSEIFIGIESGSKRIRHFINKSGDIDDIIMVVRSLINSKINVKAYFIMGFPTEKTEDLEDTYNLARALRNFADEIKSSFRISVFKFRPYHGTKLYNYLTESGVGCINIHHDDTSYGKNEFNFSAGNYSGVTDEILDTYLLKMQKLNEQVK